MDAEALVAAIGSALRIAPTRHTADQMARLVKIMKERGPSQQDPDLFDIGYQLHLFTRRFGSTDAEATTYYKCLWAAPGMPEFLLTTPLTSNYRAHIFEINARLAMAPEMPAHLPAPICAIVASYVHVDLAGFVPTGHGDPLITVAERNALREKECEYGYDETSAAQTCYLLFNLLYRSANTESCIPMRYAPATSKADGGAPFRDAPPALVARERAVQLWLDVHVHEDCGDALAPGRNFMHRVLSEPGALSRYLERGLVEVCLEEMAYDNEYYMHEDEMRRCSEMLVAVSDAQWRALSIATAGTAVAVLLCKLDIFDRGQDSKTHALCCRILGAILTPMSRLDEVCAWLDQRKRAWRYEAVAQAHYLLDEVRAHPTNALRIPTLLLRWENLEWGGKDGIKQDVFRRILPANEFGEMSETQDRIAKYWEEEKRKKEEKKK
jgi:hypothetical protein